MNPTTVAPYGSWKSPLQADLISSAVLRLGELHLVGSTIYWSEGRPSQGGRYVVVACGADQQIHDMTPEGFNVRTRVHEYGGGSFGFGENSLYFCQFADQRIYRQRLGEDPHPITPPENLRFADFVWHDRQQRLIAVCEDHRQGEPSNSLVAIHTAASSPSLETLASGHDFYASPCLSPDGTQLAWLTWDHPHMPWDAGQLWLAAIEPDGRLLDPECVAGQQPESIFQPSWSPDGTLYFVSDRTGWWNLYRYREGEIEAVYPMSAEFGQPQWVFGLSTYGFISAEELLCTYQQQGQSYLLRLNLRSGEGDPIPTPFTSISHLKVNPDQAVFIGGSPTEAAAVVALDLKTGQTQVLRRSIDISMPAGYVSLPQAIEFPTTRDLTAYGFFYPPHNQDYQAPDQERPPLLVLSHGGPTSATSSSLNLKIQYWTSRGFAVLDVNYGGSTGYGRAYRQRLRDAWGIVDVDDCVHGALYLVEQGYVDGQRLAIAGGSAGGYTTLCALTFRDVFQAGASYYGVSDLEALVRDTHKFESRYLDGLIGPYPARRDLYHQRSPIHHVEQLACPIIFFQGLEDAVVPPNQAEMMVEALRQKGLPVAYLAFAGEQHGFRQATTIQRALEAEFYFYARIFGFAPADDIPEVTIENLG